MSTEAIALIGSLAGVLALMGAGIYFWMNRTPRVTRDADGRLPLFGGDYDVDVDGNPLAAVPRHTPPPMVVPALTTPFERPVTPPSLPIAGAEGPRGPVAPAPQEPPGAAGSAAAFRVANPDDGNHPASMDVFPSPLMPPTPPRSISPVSSPAFTGEPVTPARPGPTVRTFTTNARVPARTPGPGVPPRMAPEPSAVGAPVAAHGVPGAMVEGHLLRFSVPAEGTLQFLPGRLEVAAGRDAGREIRFVRVPGPNGEEVTFGRSEGELYRHVQLRDQTVSRSHARMRLIDGTWNLLNLSQTNPVVHNGRALVGGEEQPIADGDRIEMGEVLFTFRSR